MKTLSIRLDEEFIVDAGRVKFARLISFEDAQHYVQPAGVDATPFLTVTMRCKHPSQ